MVTTRGAIMINWYFYVLAIFLQLFLIFCTLNFKISDRVYHTMAEAKVRILPGVVYDKDKMQHARGRVTSVCFNSKTGSEVVPCQVFIACQNPDIDPNIFKAVGKNGLVHDGKLVVAGDFSTVDPHVFAAGTCAKFSRKLGLMRTGFVEQRVTEHGVFDSKEVAEQLAKTLLRRIDPVQVEENQSSIDYSSELGKHPKVLLI